MELLLALSYGLLLGFLNGCYWPRKSITKPCGSNDSLTLIGFHTGKGEKING